MSLRKDDPSVLIATEVPNDKESSSAGWKIFGSIAAVATALFILFVLVFPRLGSDPAQSTTTQVTERAHSAPAPKTVDVTETSVSSENSLFCQSVEKSTDRTDRLYCDSLLPEARKVDLRLEKLENEEVPSGTSNWVIVTLTVLSVLQALTLILLAKKKNKDA